MMSNANKLSKKRRPLTSGENVAIVLSGVVVAALVLAVVQLEAPLSILIAVISFTVVYFLVRMIIRTTRK